MSTLRPLELLSVLCKYMPPLMLVRSRFNVALNVRKEANSVKAQVLFDIKVCIVFIRFLFFIMCILE